MSLEDVKTDPLSPGSDGGDNQPSPVKPGESTDPALLLESLKDERIKRREEAEARKKAEERALQAEQELEALRNTHDDDVYSDEGKALKGQISSVQERLDMQEVTAAFPVLKDKTSELNEFRKSYPGIALEKVAKLFMSERGLFNETVPRKGLEQQSGGQRTAPPSTEMTSEEVANLRINNYTKYSRLLREGKIKL